MKNPPKQNRIKSDKAQQGFTLVEVAIVLLILSIIIAPIFTILTMQRNMEKSRQDEAINNQVLAALALHLKENGEYPCPAPMGLAQNDPNFGREDCTPPGVTRVQGVGGAGTWILIGMVPVRTLNIPVRAAANVDDWRHIYAVTENLTDIATFDAVGQIEIVDDATPNNILNDEPAHFVVVNTGEDGKGSRTIDGVASPTPCATALDAENCDADFRFRDIGLNISGNPIQAAYYDDTISYTLSREESTFWMIMENQTTGGLDIVNRNMGNVGIGLAAGNTPTEKFHVQGGNMLIQRDAALGGGDLEVQGSVFSDTNITANQDVRAGVRVDSPIFFYSAP